MRDKKENNAAKMAWELFEKTGKTGYYLLYKKLKEQGEKTNR